MQSDTAIAVSDRQRLVLAQGPLSVDLLDLEIGERLELSISDCKYWVERTEDSAKSDEDPGKVVGFFVSSSYVLFKQPPEQAFADRYACLNEPFHFGNGDFTEPVRGLRII